ncbi:MAG: hypothetical protein FWD53_10105, partial [Phycisphaerales bacterium]|nr:hypothetical protein [Phycisphaerales bacterium]
YLTNQSSTVTLTIYEGPEGGKIVGKVTAKVSKGVATFKVNFPIAGEYTLVATNGLLGDLSKTFTVKPAAPARLVIAQQPTTVTAGNTLSPVVVNLVDRFGNIVAGDSTTKVSVSLNGKGATLGGTTEVTVVNGVATFDALTMTKAGDKYSLQFASGKMKAKSGFFSVVPGEATQLLFVNDPIATAAGAMIRAKKGGIAVQLADAHGNLVTTSGTFVTLSIDGTLMGTLTAPTVNGIATFSNLSIEQAGEYVLLANSGILSGSSGTFTINPAAATRIEFVQQPADVNSGTMLIPAFEVRLLDRFGNVAAFERSAIKLQIVSGPAGGKLFGSTSVKPNNGTARFDNVSLQTSGQYVIRATYGRLSIESDPFIV